MSATTRQVTYPDDQVSQEPLELIRAIEADSRRDDAMAMRFRRLFNELAQANAKIASLMVLLYGPNPLKDY